MVAAVGAAERQLYLGATIFLLALAASVIGAEVEPATFFSKIGNFTSYFDRLLTLDSGARVWTDPAEWFWGLHRWLRLLGETLLIAYVGTLSGAALAFAGCFAASRNLVPAWLCLVVRRALELLRTVPDLVFALVFVEAFGLGALPGVLALTLHSAGSLGKLFTEVVESIDMRLGRGRHRRRRFLVRARAVWCVAASAVEFRQLYAAASGDQCARGGGDRLRRRQSGSAWTLLTAIRKFGYADVSAMLVMLVACVMLLDVASERMCLSRHHLLVLEVLPMSAGLRESRR